MNINVVPLRFRLRGRESKQSEAELLGEGGEGTKKGRPIGRPFFAFME